MTVDDGSAWPLEKLLYVQYDNDTMLIYMS